MLSPKDLVFQNANILVDFGLVDKIRKSAILTVLSFIY